MDFRFTPEQDAWRAEVRAFFQRELTGELRADLRRRNTTYSPELWKKLGQAGYLGITWPKEYGGRDLTFWHHMIFTEEAVRADCPITIMAGIGNTISQLGGALLAFGTEEQKRKFLPAITRGDLTSAEGLTEPNAGSDLAALETVAAPDGDGWLLNGTKAFSHAHLTDYLFTLARTDPSLGRHRGLTFFIVDTHAPGVSIEPYWTMGRWRRDIVTLKDVWVPRDMIVGEVNRGWYQFVGGRQGPGSEAKDLTEVMTTFNQAVAYLKTAKRNGKPLWEQPAVRQAVAEMAADLKAAELMSHHVLWLNANGLDSGSAASSAKISVSELEEQIVSTLMDLVGEYAALETWGEEAPGVPLAGRLPHVYRDIKIHQMGGGTSEVKRNLLAQRGLGLPRD